MTNITDLKLRKDIPDIVSYINELFDHAISDNVSDIHIETTKDSILVRFRKDGDFFIYDKIALENVSSIVTRLKVLGKVKR